MKIHIVREGQETIENYKKVTVSNNSVDLSDISDNECTFILAGDTLDNFSLEKMSKEFCKYIDKGLSNMPQQVSLSLPKLKKTETSKEEKIKLPKLKKVEA